MPRGRQRLAWSLLVRGVTELTGREVVDPTGLTDAGVDAYSWLRRARRSAR